MAAKKVILYYKFIEVPNPEKEVSDHRAVCQNLGLLGRVIIGNEGINGTLEGTKKQTSDYKNYLNSHLLFNSIFFKETESKTQTFNKLKIKFRPEIVTLETKVDLKKTGKRISPEELHKTLENNEDITLVDMRNSYESAIGRFRGAVEIATENFRDLPERIAAIKNLKEKKIVTYCTGGIRCEKASAFLVEKGFKNVYQLDGGILKYAQKYPDGFFEGKCFVFDQRMSVSFEKEKNTVLTKCEHCQEKSDRYLDCADNTCHRLFIVCADCEKTKSSLCKLAHSARVSDSSPVNNFSIQ